MIQVTVLEFAGETGLRPIGAIYLENEARAQALASRGLVSLPMDPNDDLAAGPTPIKEEKAQIETKELKFQPATKSQPAKPRAKRTRATKPKKR
jgi:hypothetical protein